MLDNVGAGVEQFMNLVSARQKLVASNIANADTPGYQTKDIDFQSELQSQLTGSKPNVIEVSGLKNKNDGNTWIWTGSAPAGRECIALQRRLTIGTF